MPHPCPHHCPKGGGGAAAATAVLAVVVIAAIARTAIRVAEDIIVIAAIAVTVIIVVAAIGATAYIALRARSSHARTGQKVSWHTPRALSGSQAVSGPQRRAIEPRRVIGDVIVRDHDASENTERRFLP